MLRMYDSHLSQLAPGVMVSGAAAACDLEALRRAGVTHVINCAALQCPNHHPHALTYMSLPLIDSLREDISSSLYAAIDFIVEALDGGGAVLIHCMHGVSRSASIGIAYAIWKRGCTYEEAFESARSVRPTINPNIGFACALLAWQEAVRPPPALPAPGVWALLPSKRSPPGG